MVMTTRELILEEEKGKIIPVAGGRRYCVSREPMESEVEKSIRYLPDI